MSAESQEATPQTTYCMTVYYTADYGTEFERPFPDDAAALAVYKQRRAFYAAHCQAMRYTTLRTELWALRQQPDEADRLVTYRDGL